MASLLSLLKASGQPTTLTDDENEALQVQQEAAAQQTSGVNALMGVDAGDTPTEAEAAPADDAQPTLLNAIKKGSSDDQGSDANPSYATDSQKAEEAASQTDTADAPSASDDSTSTATSDANQSNGASSSDAGSASADGSSSDGFGTKLINFLKKDFNRAMSDPNLFQSMMAAGAGTLAHANYGTSGASALGQGMQEGQKYYQARLQQQIANNMAQAQYQRQAAKDKSEIDAKDEETRGKKIANDQTGLRMNVFGQIQAGKVSPKDPRVGAALASTGMKPDEITSAMQGWAPELGTPQEYMDPKTGIQMVQDRTKTGQLIGQAYPKAVAPTSLSAGNTLVNTQAPDASGNASVVANGGVPLDQQKSARDASDKAADAKTTMDMSGQAIQAYNDPAYQKLMKDGLLGKAKSYLQSKYSMQTDPLAIIDAQINDLNKAKTLTTVLGSGVGKLDRPVQQAVMEGSLDVRSLPLDQKLQIANMIYNQSKDSYERNSRTAAWDSQVVGNSVSKDMKLNDGTVIPGGSTRENYIMGTQKGNALGLPEAKKQANAPVFNKSDLQAEMKRRGLIK
ncbi:hypothetical protein AWB76_00945 [Caballeronia temeraria]|uniref:Uncharacterized protein n=1 Tax=Caballeronia temeraria TaxID=1777137 RepID=A0A157ZMA1_9BURK|nr:hypothetical protein [Caballeronia temeraria]SAK46623.1 hypothetical protein AWB76_00945 [Caballeronia temeraria]